VPETTRLAMARLITLYPLGGATGSMCNAVRLHASADETLDLLCIAAHAEAGDDLDHAEHDQRNADHQCQRHDRVERVLFALSLVCPQARCVDVCLRRSARTELAP